MQASIVSSRYGAHILSQPHHLLNHCPTWRHAEVNGDRVRLLNDVNTCFSHLHARSSHDPQAFATFPIFKTNTITSIHVLAGCEGCAICKSRSEGVTWRVQQTVSWFKGWQHRWICSSTGCCCGYLGWAYGIAWSKTIAWAYTWVRAAKSGCCGEGGGNKGSGCPTGVPTSR